MDDMFPTSNRSICPCNDCVLASFAQSTPQISVSSIETAPQPSYGGDWIEVERLGQKHKSISFAGWFRRHSDPWNHTSDALPLTAGNFADIETGPNSLEAERARIIEQISEIRELHQFNTNNLPGNQHCFKEWSDPCHAQASNIDSR